MCATRREFIASICAPRSPDSAQPHVRSTGVSPVLEYAQARRLCHERCAQGAQKSLPGVATGKSVATQFVTALSRRFAIVNISRATCSDLRRGVATVCAVAGRVATEGAVPQLHGVQWHALSRDAKGVRSAPHRGCSAAAARSTAARPEQGCEGRAVRTTPRVQCRSCTEYSGTP
jgi:hypothetical protein